MSLEQNNMPIFFPSDLFIPPKQIERYLNIRNYNQQPRQPLPLRQPTKQQIQQIQQPRHIQSIKLKNKSNDLQFKIF